MRPSLSIIRSRNTSSFTLIELLVVIAIIGMLASIAVPTIARTMDKGKIAPEMGKARTWGEIVQLVQGEVFSGDTNYSPFTGTNAADLPKWYAGIVRAVGTNAALKLFSADTVRPNSWNTNTGPNTNPYFIYACEEQTEADIMLTTRNWQLTPGGNGPPLNASAKPFGKIGAVIFFKNGGAVSITPATSTNSVTNWGIVSNALN